jgi:hypothetical protein
MTEFDMKGALTRLSELEVTLSEQLEPEIRKNAEQQQTQMGRRPLDLLDRTHTNIKLVDNPAHAYLSIMISNLKNGTFWHSMHHWDKVKKILSDEEATFYSTLAIEQAKIGFTKNSVQGNKTKGHAWIVLNHDKGNFSHLKLPKKDLVDTVTKGFMEFSEQYFYGGEIVHCEQDQLMHEDYLPEYHAILNNFQLLNKNSLVESLKERPLRAYIHENPLCEDEHDPDRWKIGAWPDERYISLIDAEIKSGKTSLDTLAHFVRPIIELYAIRSFESPLVEMDGGIELEKITEKYKQFIATEPIQELLTDFCANAIMNKGVFEESQMPKVEVAQELMTYITSN